MTKKENEKVTFQDLENCEKQRKTSKMRNIHCRTWNIWRNQKNEENEKAT